MAKRRQARRCRARSSRTGAPCRAWAVTGAVVCRAHGAGSPAVRAAAAQRREREQKRGGRWEAATVHSVLKAQPELEPV
jgi:hypothetical protein